MIAIGAEVNVEAANLYKMNASLNVFEANFILNILYARANTLDINRVRSLAILLMVIIN